MSKVQSTCQQEFFRKLNFLKKMFFQTLLDVDRNHFLFCEKKVCQCCQNWILRVHSNSLMLNFSGKKKIYNFFDLSWTLNDFFSALRSFSMRLSKRHSNCPEVRSILTRKNWIDICMFHYHFRIFREINRLPGNFFCRFSKTAIHASFISVGGEFFSDKNNKIQNIFRQWAKSFQFLSEILRRVCQTTFHCLEEQFEEKFFLTKKIFFNSHLDFDRKCFSLLWYVVFGRFFRTAFQMSIGLF